MADAVGVQQVERAPDRLGPDDLARVRHRAEPRLARDPEHVHVQVGRVLGLVAAEADGDDASILVLDRIADGRLRLLWHPAAGQVGRQPHLDSVALARLLDAVAVAAEDLVQVDAAPCLLRRGEDALDVDAALLLRLERVLDRDPPEVVRGPQDGRRQQPGPDEVLEVAEAVELAQVLDRLDRERNAIPAAEREQGLRADGALEVDVELDLRIAHALNHRSSFGHW